MMQVTRKESKEGKAQAQRQGGQEGEETEKGEEEKGQTCWGGQG
jgi:hypothetical protein